MIVNFQQTYGHFKSLLHSAPDRSAIFLTDLAGRTVKKLPSLKGPGFDPRLGRTKRAWSIESKRFYKISKDSSKQFQEIFQKIQKKKFYWITYSV